MKSFLLLVLTAGVLLTSAQADILVPQPTSITVRNLAAFPKYKFSYLPENDPKQVRPVEDGRTFAVLNNVQLLIQSGSEPAQVWAKIKHERRGAAISIVVEGVREKDKTISVTYKTSDRGTVPGKKSAHTAPESLPLFALAGLGTCGLVLLARRGRKTA